MKEAFQKADDVLLEAVRGISELVTVPGLINLDFADVRSVMADMGMAMMGTACASGEDRAVDAAQRAISCPLLEDMSIKGARGLLINVSGSPDMSLYEVHEAASLIQQEAHEDANIIFGAVIDEQLGDEIRVTVIATGFREQRREPERHNSRYAPGQTIPGARNDVRSQAVQVHSLLDGSTTDASPSPQVQLQPPPDLSIPEAPPQPPHSAMFNDNRRPVRRLGLIDDKVLDKPKFKQRNCEQGLAATQIGENRFERDNDLDAEQTARESHRLAETGIYRAPELPEPDALDSFDRAANSPTMATSGYMRRAELIVERQLANAELRLESLLNQFWRPTKPARLTPLLPRDRDS